MFVRFALSAKLHFSREITPEAVEAIETAVQEANRQLFRRGTPSGAPEEQIGRITRWQVNASALALDIESGPFTRAHDALFRFRKHIAQVLGRYRLGVREISIAAFRITMPGPIPDEAIPKLPFIRQVRRQDGAVELDLLFSASDLEGRVPDRLVRLIEEKKEALTYGGKAEHWELIYESEQRPRVYAGDPTQEMIERGWIRHGASRGQWIFAPQAVHLFRAFEAIVMDHVIRPLGFSEMVFPKLVPWEVWMRSGHAKGVYPEIYYVCTPKTRDPAYWEDIGDYFKVTGVVPVEEIRKRIDGPIGGMCYAQCPPFWPFVQGETLANSCLPIRVFDRSGTSHRYESGGIHGIERVDEFHRIEVLWLGTAEQTIAIADELHEAYRHIFDDILELEWRSAKVTPWFMAQEGLVGESADAAIGTRDYEAVLPYSGTWLEFQNVSVNGDKYPKGFNVKIQSGAECWSGCSGIGLERWTAAFLAQKGFDTSDWPETVAKLAGEPQEIFTFL
ncbi:MAG: serine--tRNA ligase [Methanomicrobiaceae archaeon]|uniref:Seryl-trna synthetase, archaeal n=1 Tax=hydrocarbon metagenome TaxID=938273 RepID=A0A0W8FJN8_9ZZZZ|nr:serine--tRNA ligase [Methanomicrobiaceae archaeon]MDD5418983.1 serine--tRNA ligase [Methanomicrobiaceae archaeon]